MTICIGMLASDGVVIAADALESDQYYKRSQQKIVTFLGAIQLGNNPDSKPPSMACAFTGAGEAGYIDAFIGEALRDISTKSTQNEFQDFLAEKTQTFYERHIFPLASAIHPPGLEILIGAYVGWHTSMFVSHGSTLRKVFPHAAVGLGAHFALSVINDLGGIYDLKRTELLAAYVVAATKERIEGCGQYTAIVSLHNPSIVEDVPGGPSQLVAPSHPLTHVSGKKIQKWEESFGTLWATRQTKLLKELIEEELADGHE